MGSIKNYLRKIIPLRTSTYLIGRNSIEKKLADVKDDIAKLDMRLDAIVADLSELSNSIAALSEISATTDTRVAVESSVTQAALQELKARVAAIEERNSFVNRQF